MKIRVLGILILGFSCMFVTRLFPGGCLGKPIKKKQRLSCYLSQVLGKADEVKESKSSDGSDSDVNRFVNKVDADGRTLIYKVLQEESKNQVSWLKRLIGKGAAVNIRDKNGLTPLHEAARSGCWEAIYLLIEADADVNAQDNYLNTPLHIAVMYANFECIFRLIVGGANPLARNCESKKPRDYASMIAKGQEDLLTNMQGIIDEAIKERERVVNEAIKERECEVLAKIIDNYSNADELRYSISMNSKCKL